MYVVLLLRLPVRCDMKKEGKKRKLTGTNNKQQPFNAFLAGFGATVGQFVLAAGLRVQTDGGNRGEFGSVGHERWVCFLL